MTAINRHGTLEFFLPELCISVNCRERLLRDRLEHLLSKSLFRQPVGPRPAGTIAIECQLSDTHAVSAPGEKVLPLPNGYRSWRRPHDQDTDHLAIPLLGSLERRRYLGNGYITTRILEHSRVPSMSLRVHPAVLHRDTEDLELCLRHALALMLPRLGFFPMEASIARGFLPGDHRGQRTTQVLLLGAESVRTATLTALSKLGWVTSDRELLFLRKDEGGTYIVSGCNSLPVVFPRQVLLFDRRLGGAVESRLGRCNGDTPNFRNLFFHLLSSTIASDESMAPGLRREHDEILRQLLSQCDPLKVTWRRQERPAHVARQALKLLGLDEWKGWDLPSPRTHRVRSS